MRSQRSILALRYTPVSVAGGVRRAVGGFLRYVQYRDQHLEPDAVRAVDAYVRYVAHRDRTSARGRVFGRDGERSDEDRRRFVDFVARSTKGLQPRWVSTRDGKREDRQRAVYTFILSPEDWRGLDLRQLTRAAMRQLETDAGVGGIGPWFAAEHRNTAHHHVHIVLAARRETSPGRLNTFIVTRPRLQRMKDAIALVIEGQRVRGREPRLEPARIQSPTLTRQLLPPRERRRWLSPREAVVRLRSRSPRHHGLGRPVSATLLHLRAAARRYHHQMERELERELVRADREGWVR